MKNATLPLTQFFSTIARAAFAVWVSYYLLNIVTFWLTDKAYPATLKLDFIPNYGLIVIGLALAAHLTTLIIGNRKKKADKTDTPKT